MPGRKKQAVSPKEEAQQGRIIERPDGFYWESKENKELRGPFETRGEAEADLLAGGAAPDEFDAKDTLQEADRRRAMESGFDHHLVKPVDPNALNALLAEVSEK